MAEGSIQEWLQSLKVYDFSDDSWEELYRQTTGQRPFVVNEIFYHQFITSEPTKGISAVHLAPDLESTLEPLTEKEMRDAGVVAIVRTRTLSCEPIGNPDGVHQVHKAYAVGHYDND